jgi:hypothetical protein
MAGAACAVAAHLDHTVAEIDAKIAEMIPDLILTGAIDAADLVARSPSLRLGQCSVATKARDLSNAMSQAAQL